MIGEVFGASMRNLTEDEVKIHLQELPPDQPFHDVKVVPGSRLSSIVKMRMMKTNSFHRQVLVLPPKGFRACCVYGSNIIEGIEHRRLPMMGLQFHPERLMLKIENRRIFRHFAAQCRRYRMTRKLWNLLAF
jgi:putative glutamine amidotransferase